MSEKTPKRRSVPLNNGFSPIILPESPAAASPQRNLTGLPRGIRDLAADVYNNIQKWNDLHVRGATLVKQIASIKSETPNLFNSSLENLTTDLYQVVEDLRKIKVLLGSFWPRIEASAQLQKDSSCPLFISRTIDSLAKLVRDIAEAYEAEFEMKQQVLENIAHSRNENDAMFYAVLWTYQSKITESINLKLATLLVETGHWKPS